MGGLNLKPNSEEAKRKDKENLRRLFGLPSNSK